MNRFKPLAPLLRLHNQKILFSHFQKTVASLSATTRYPRLSAFLPIHFIKWISKYLSAVTHAKTPFRTYPPGQTGVYPIPASCLFGIAGDWGTGTLAAKSVSDRIEKLDPDYTIHLGDIYYVGEEDEVWENCLGHDTKNFTGVLWPLGKRGSFALNGNHEMYSGGEAYFDTFLGILNQPASFFCLENDFVRIIGLDTGYNSDGPPIVGAIPWLNKIPGLDADCHLEPELVDWLRDITATPKPTILLSHHPCFSAFEEHSLPAVTKQIRSFFANQTVLWIWGHEHRMAVYEPHSANGHFNVLGVCCGHGGMPVSTSAPERKVPALRAYDTRTQKLHNGATVGINGYMTMRLNDGIITLSFYDLVDNLIYQQPYRIEGHDIVLETSQLPAKE